MTDAEREQLFRKFTPHCPDCGHADCSPLGGVIVKDVKGNMVRAFECRGCTLKFRAWITPSGARGSGAIEEMHDQQERKA